MKNNLQKLIIQMFYTCLYAVVWSRQEVVRDNLLFETFCALLVVLYLRSYKLYAIKITSKCALF